MKKNLNRLLIFILTLTVICACLSACGSNSSGYSDKYFAAPESAMGVVNDSSLGFNSTTGSVGESYAEELPEQTTQKLVYTATINIETKSYDDAVATIRQSVSDMNGYIENTDSYSYNESNRSVYFKIRIPVASYQEFLNAVCEIGSVRHKSENVEDITASYLDVEARLGSLETKMDRLEELQQEAENLDQLLLIEDQISDTQYQIESYTSQLNHMKNRVSYCTVNVNLEEVVVYSQKPSFASEISEAHSDTIDGFIRFLKDFVLFIIYVYPYAIITTIIVLLAVHIRKKRKQARIAAKKVSIPAPEKTKEPVEVRPPQK